MTQLFGKYRAFVVVNEETTPDKDNPQPFKGCIKVICPDLFGFQTSPVDDEAFTTLKEKMTVSPWVRPCWPHPMDHYIPELGEGVYVEPVNGNYRDLVYSGFYPGEDFTNEWDHKQKEGLNTQASEKTDRIFGCRNGSYIKIEDKDNGKMTIECYGKNKLNTSRKGCTIVFDPQLQKITLTAQDSTGATKTEAILIKDSFELKDSNENDIKSSSSGLEIKDKNGHKIVFSSSGIKLEVSGGSTVELTSSKVSINGTALEVDK